MGKQIKRAKSAPPDDAAIANRAEPVVRRSRRAFWIVTGLVVLLIAAIFGQGVDAPFIFDDYAAIVKNSSISQLWPLVGDDINPGPLNPSPHLPTSARPVVNLSLALNYAVGEADPAGYRLVNVTLHIFSTLLLWTIVLRTLRMPRLHVEETTAIWLASATAVLWAVHPLQTETVVYATQRTEGMMAFFYLATMYCSLRYWASATRNGRSLWLIIAVLACIAGMLSKEVMVSAPLMILLYDRTFVAQSLGKAIRNSWPLYAGLFGTWIILVLQNLSNPHGDVAGFDTEVPLLYSWMTQAKVFLLYVKLMFWPWPLQIHYAVPYLSSIAQAWPYLLAVAVVGLATLVLLWRNHPLGYLGAWVFVILSPTSLVPITTEVAAERRLYLPLAAVVALVVIGAYMLAEAMLRRTRDREGAEAASLLPRIAIAIAVLIGVVFTALSAERVAAYQNPRELWSDVVRRQPDNFLALQSLAAELARSGEHEEALGWFRRAIKLKPNQELAHSELGRVLLKVNRFDEALAEFEEAARLKPKVAEHRNNVGVVHFQAGRFDEAMPHFRQAIELDPRMWMAYDNLGKSLAMTGKLQEAVQQYEHAIEINPQALDVYGHLADAYAHLQQPQQAIAAAEQALKLARSTRQREIAEQIAVQIDAYREAMAQGKSSDEVDLVPIPATE